MAGFGTIKPKSGNKDSLKLHEVIEMHKWPDDKWSVVRFLETPIISVKRHWINIVAGKEKKLITIPRYCLAHNILNEHEPRLDKKGKPVKCPYCDLVHGRDDNASARAEFFYLANAIIREIQEDEPRKKSPPTKEEKASGFKDIRSKTWTPVRACRITSSVALRIQELSEGNTVKDKKTGKKVAYDVTHPKHGIDIRIKYKPKAAGTDKYSADADERSPLSEEEKGYLIWDLSDNLLDATGRTTFEQAVEDFKRMEVVGGDTPDDDDDDDDDGYSLGDKKGKKSKKKSKAAFSDDDDDSDSDDDDDSDSDDDDDEPKSSKKKKGSKDKKSKKRAFDDDDDDDSDSDDDDDEPKKSKSKKGSKDKVKAKKRASFDDDDDDDDEPKKPKKKKSKIDDDDDEDEPKAKKKKSSGDKVKKKKKSK